MLIVVFFVMVIRVCVGGSLCSVSEERPSARPAEVKQESQTALYNTSHNELNETLLMEPSDIKMFPSEETPAPGEGLFVLGCDFNAYH